MHLTVLIMREADEGEGNARNRFWSVDLKDGEQARIFRRNFNGLKKVLTDVHGTIEGYTA